jgi:F0F1-type ATP synthase membrane subunit c/vacuolar-type H+-ATPase subunit K
MVGIPERKSNERSLQTLWIIWAAMLGTLFIYVLICHLWENEMRQITSPNFPLDLIRNILYGIAIFTLILTRFIRKFILSGRPDGPGPKPMKPPSLSNQSSPLDKYVPAMFVSLALSEFIGIMGLVLFFLGDNYQVFYSFIAISALAMFFYRPRKEELETSAIAVQTN